MDGLVAMMQSPRYMVEDVHGNKHPLFNGKTGEFIFDTKTLELKPEFKTEKNIANWEHFTTSADGINPSEILFLRFDQMRNSSQGNYKSTSKVGIEKTYIGAASTTFLKWMPELVNNEIGNNTLDPIWMKQNTMGRLATIYAQKPYVYLGILALETASVPLNVITTISFFAISNPLKAESWSNVVTGLFKSFGGLISIAMVTRGAEALAWSKVLVANRNLKDANSAYKATRINRKAFLEARKQSLNKSTTIDKASEILKMTLELGLRTSRTTTGLITGAVTRKRRTLLKDERIKNIIDLHEEKYRDRDISYEDRLLISEKLQSYAESVSQAITGLIVLHAYKAAYSLLAALFYDDDEAVYDDYETLRKRLEAIYNDEEKRREIFNKVEPIIGNYENKMRYLINLQGSIQQEISQFSHPFGLYSMFDGFIMKQQFDRITDKLNSAIEDEDINKTFYEKYSTPVVNTIGMTTGIPNTILKPITGRELFGYERVFGDYDKVSKTRIYSEVLDFNKTSEEKHKEFFLEKRKDIRDVYNNRLDSEIERLSTELGKELTEEEIKTFKEKRKNNFYKKNNLSTNKNTKYETKVKNINWEELEKKAESEELKNFIVPSTRKKKAKANSPYSPKIIK